MPLAVAVICILVELTLTASDWNWFANTRLRPLAYEYAGFWPGLLRDWGQNYPYQKYLMFLSYGFLHGGLIHLGVNLYTLLALGRLVVERVGNLRFGLLYLGALLGGALAYGLLAKELQPMVGASGALFGLAGALIAWNYVDRFTYSEGLWPVARMVLYLLAVNIVLWWAMSGQLAWQTHLGGFISGWVLALLIDPRSRAEDES
jgi:rhomboid protease GluP